MLEKLIKISKIACLFGLTVALLSLSAVFITTAYTVAATKKVVDGLPVLVSTEMDKTRTTLNGQLNTLQTNLIAQVDKANTNLNVRVGDALTVTDKRIGKISDDLFAQVKDTREVLDKQITTTNTSVSTLVTAYAKIPDIIGVTYQKDFNPYFNCTANKLCIQGQFADTLFAVRQTSRDTSEAMGTINTTLPVISTDFKGVSFALNRDIPKITDNFASITSNVNKLTTVKWYDRLLGYGLNAAVLYRTINPATNLTIKGTTMGIQGVSSLITKP